MNKKIMQMTALTCAVALGAINTSSAYAQSNHQEIISDKKVKEYTYTYKGIEFSGFTPLSEKQLEAFYNSLTASSSEITTYQIPNENSAEIVYGPKYDSFTNGLEKELANIIVSWVVSKIPTPIKTNVLVNWTIAKLTNFAQNTFQPVYVGYWVWMVQDSDYKSDIYYETVVNYTDSTYKKTKSVQYYEIDRKHW